MTRCHHRNCLSPSDLDRRSFVKSAAVGVATMLLSDVFPGRVRAADPSQLVQLSTYPRTRIAKVSELSLHQPLPFNYPTDGLHTESLLIRLGTRAGGGVGPEQDIVAFNGRCTHMGGDVTDGYAAEYHLLSCAEHLATFDLTRHGMIIAGHATQSLPQIVLELVDDDLFARGIVGLLYGYHTNPLPDVPSDDSTSKGNSK